MLSPMARIARSALRGPAIGAALAAAASPVTAEPRACAVAAVEGAPALLWTAGVWSPLAVGPLPAGALKVATGPGARVELRCDGPITVTVGAGTEVNLDALTEGAPPGDGVILQLLRGVIGLVAPERDWDRFEVRTPLAIASARSTEWLVEYGGPTGAAVFVREGAVAVDPVRGPTVVLGAGEGVTVPADGPALAVIRWGPPRIAGVGATLGFGWR